MNEGPRAFISYRREDALGVAAALARELERVLTTGTVFLDHRSLGPGEPWPERLRKEVQRADAVLLLIGPHWLTVQGADGIRRLDDPDDWVRQELEAALEAARTVIPVLVDGASPLDRRAFRTISHLAGVADLHAIRLSTTEWDATFDALVNRLAILGFRSVTGESGPIPGRLRRFHSTIPSRGHAPFIGRDDVIQELAEWLSDAGTQTFVVLHGSPGVGKSELAYEYARRNLQRYPGGAFHVSLREKGPPVDLATTGRGVLGLDFSPELVLHDQCIRTVHSLGDAPFLLVYDNAADPDGVAPWLPPAGLGGHVIVTSTWNQWDPKWRELRVAPMVDDEAMSLVAAIVGEGVVPALARRIVRIAGGLPVQIVPAAQNLRLTLERRQTPEPLDQLTKRARESIEAPWTQLPDEGRLLLSGALCFHPDRVSHAILGNAFAKIGFTREEFRSALGRCQSVALLTGWSQLRFHTLWGRYFREHAHEVNPERLRALRTALEAVFMEAAQSVSENPTDTRAVETFTTFSTSPARWRTDSTTLTSSSMDASVVGGALLGIGHFAEAQRWFEHAVEDAERRDHGRAPGEGLSASLHALGDCLSERGRFEEAQPWYERAVMEEERGDVNGRIDHARLGSSLHQVGHCLSSRGQFAEARPSYERAVTEKQRGDGGGRVDHASLAISLHSVGSCLFFQGQFAEARLWYERAVAEAERGDVDGLVHHESLGVSLHSVGDCVCRLGDFSEARQWYERAVAEKEQGDVYGRVDHASLSFSLDAVGSCLALPGQFMEARAWYERAVMEAERGDVHGRVDHARLGTSLHKVGYCLSAEGQFEAAQQWYERAVAEKQRGDVHARVIHASLGSSLHQVGYCLASRGQFAEALPWYERAVAERQSELDGYVDHAGLADTLHALGDCLASQGRVAEAQAWYERAVERKQRD